MIGASSHFADEDFHALMSMSVGTPAGCVLERLNPALRLRGAGLSARVEHYRLEEHGLIGDGHLAVLEKNSSQVSELIGQWVEQSIRSPRDSIA